MSHQEVTYAFQNGQAYAIHHGKVIASGADLDGVEQQVKLAFGDPGYGEQRAWDESRGPDEIPGGALGHEPRCEHCDGTREECERGGCGPGNFAPAGSVENPDPGNPMYDHLSPHHHPSPGYPGEMQSPGYMAKTVITPNGLKGTVLGKVASTWGEEVTVRLENGRIVHLPTNTELHPVQRKQASRPPDRIEILEARLAKSVDGTHASLVARYSELEQVRGYASELIRQGANHAQSLRLDQLVVAAEVEQREIAEAVAHIDAAEPIAPPSFTIAAADRSSRMSREDASWLDHTMDEMIKQAEAQDFGKLMDEGPEALVAELNDAALADADVTRQVAASFVSERTAGVDRTVVEPYTATFLARVEERRQAELDNRKTPTHKEAAVEADTFKDVPDDALFM